MAGHREGSMYKERKHVIPTAAAFGGAILGLLSIAADLWARTGVNSITFWQVSDSDLIIIHTDFILGEPAAISNSILCRNGHITHSSICSPMRASFLFSQGNHDVTLRRSQIGPDLMEALKMLKFSLRNGRCLDFTIGTTKEEELEALEMEMRDELGIPDDTDVHLTV
jgi:hypothetical protein